MARCSMEYVELLSTARYLCSGLSRVSPPPPPPPLASIEPGNERGPETIASSETSINQIGNEEDPRSFPYMILVEKKETLNCTEELRGPSIEGDNRVERNERALVVQQQVCPCRELELAPGANTEMI